MYRNCLRDVLGYKEGERAFFLSETGLETTLLFKEGIDIPCFASFPLLKSNPEVLKKFLEEHVLCAVKYNANFILDSAGWRANADWGQKLGLSTHELDDFNRLSIKLLSDIRDKYQRSGMTMVISGVVGPRSDGYSPQLLMTAEQARNYHRHQISVYKDTTADLVTAYTMCYVQEPLGIVQAAKEMGMPVVISFTLEFDGTLPSGMSLQDAIETIDRATDSYPLYYMINCAHPTHFMHVLQEAHAQGGEEGEGGQWVGRLRGIKGNASKKSHAELDDSDSLDRGDVEEFGRCYQQIRSLWPHITLLSGCCGTDIQHLEAICRHCL